VRRRRAEPRWLGALDAASAIDIGILGAGRVGQLLHGGLAALGHRVVVGTREPGRSASHRDARVRAWRAALIGDGRLATFAEAAAHGALVVNATAGAGALDALRLAGEPNLAGKILLDLSNPLDVSADGRPALFVHGADSLGERIQRALPRTRVVKALNTVSAETMAAPERVGDGEHTVFMSGDDGAAKSIVAALLRALGWRDILDLGDISTARATEMLLPLGLTIGRVLGATPFNLKVVRSAGTSRVAAPNVRTPSYRELR
jgi:predicted dinucleotide-binding enzyme